MAGIACAITITTPVTGLVFSFDASRAICHGPLWAIGYAQTALTVTLVDAVFIAYRKDMSRTISHVIMVGTPMLVLLGLFQIVYPSVLLNGMIGACLAIVLQVTIQNSSCDIDPLTELGNQQAFLAELDERRRFHDSYQVLLASIVDFRNLNVTYGIMRASRLMRSFSNWLCTLFEGGRVFRVESTSFAIVLPLEGGTDPAAHVELLSRKAACEWSRREGGQLHVRCIDYVCVNGDANPADVLEWLSFAETRAKRCELPELHVEDSLVSEVVHQKLLTNYLETSVKEGLFQVWVQPIRDMRTGRDATAEALLRLRDADGKLIPPSEFVPVAEQSSLIPAIGWQTLEKVCEFLSTHPDLPLETVSINLTMRQLAEPGFCDKVTETLARWGIPDGRISFEITERMLVSKDTRVEEALDGMLESNRSFLLDDFGTGYSNFSSMMEFPFEKIKLDKTLLRDGSEDGYATVGTLVELFHRRGRLVVVEGVETQQEAERVRELGADFVQGFYYARPMPLEDYVAFATAIGKTVA